MTDVVRTSDEAATTDGTTAPGERIGDGNRQGRRMHKILVCILNAKVGEICSRGSQVVDLAKGIFRAVSVPMDES